jgi:5-methylthioadenosine/S-adenosylhomocysteine deaminase
VHKALSSDSTAINAKTALKMATENAAKAISWDNIGSLKAGYQADFMVVSYESVHMQPLFNPLSNLIYSGQQHDITDVFVAGRQLMKNRELTTIDEKELIAKAKRWVEKIL